jgi:hypothetical protein
MKMYPQQATQITSKFISMLSRNFPNGTACFPVRGVTGQFFFFFKFRKNILGLETELSPECSIVFPSPEWSIVFPFPGLSGIFPSPG